MLNSFLRFYTQKSCQLEHTL